MEDQIEQLKKENQQLKQQIEYLESVISDLRNVTAVNNLKTFGN